jgi:hypothetical protein
VDQKFKEKKKCSQWLMLVTLATWVTLGSRSNQINRLQNPISPKNKIKLEKNKKNPQQNGVEVWLKW